MGIMTLSMSLFSIIPMAISLMRYNMIDDDRYNDSVYVMILYNTITHVVSLVDRYELIELFFCIP